MQSKSLDTITDLTLDIVDVLIPGGPLLAVSRRSFLEIERLLTGSIAVRFSVVRMS